MSALTSTPVESATGRLTSSHNSAKASSSSYVPPALPNETVVYQSNHVLVSDQRLVVGIRSYKITDIQNAYIRKLGTRHLPLLGLLLIGGLFSTWLLSFWPLLGAVIVGLLGASLFGLVRSVRPNYVLRVTTSEGEIDVLMSLDRAYIHSANNALALVLNNSR